MKLIVRALRKGGGSFQLAIGPHGAHQFRPKFKTILAPFWFRRNFEFGASHMGDGNPTEALELPLNDRSSYRLLLDDVIMLLSSTWWGRA
jgi:hypothetical protein